MYHALYICTQLFIHRERERYILSVYVYYMYVYFVNYVHRGKLCALHINTSPLQYKAVRKHDTSSHGLEEVVEP